MYDVIVVGAGIVGLAHALAAAERGARVLVLDRDARATGASVRNFGFVTVSGQARGDVWQLARRSAAVWRAVARAAGIAIVQEGLTLVARRPEAAAVLEAFMATEMAEGCEMLASGSLSATLPALRPGAIVAALRSTRDLRVESRDAVALLADWLARAHGVTFRRGVAVAEVVAGGVITAERSYTAAAVIACPGDEGAALFPHAFATNGVQRCTLQMLRLAAPGYRLATPVMSDLSLVRYAGFADLPEAAALATRLEREEREAIAHGIHLIAVQSADGTLVVGDSHVYGDSVAPFARADIDDAILAQWSALFGTAPRVIERWIGSYASIAGRHSLVTVLFPGVRLVVVTSGTGASTAFALAQDVIAGLAAEGHCR
ncbi:TIGR03364 family FAD-dependent oxidoreductase [Sphingomonas yunnanensis]|uniref:TIGR03364 family FAD-dependent oxidoreductase n=1 Tax=Sphingomonas yunnanensis TaxID=310400 RepID=UPI001CA69761|nr:TIGR03364 family FAD-dependent oxidoreductase [Sphingomonas yunnanensis]MBY9063635.1 TIGR03364 family FAD-dependent oxidoreductase [Sphingomonas yunnanensis]